VSSHRLRSAEIRASRNGRYPEIPGVYSSSHFFDLTASIFAKTKGEHIACRTVPQHKPVLEFTRGGSSATLLRPICGGLVGDQNEH
jgi:hypothetical protein